MDSINLGTAHASIEIRLDKLEAQVARAKSDFDKLGNDLNHRADRIKLDLSSKFGELGRTLSMAVTAPMAALGTAAIKAATDMDSLKRGLTAVAGSSKEAERQLVRLKEVAKLPGLGFQEAVRGSINLQAAGMSANMAERALKGFGNALATVGKGKADLDGVSLALTQIAAKGKISAEEINQLQERVPQIRQIMKEAFGTADTEVLQKAKIGATEFFDAVISRLEKLPAVTGGAQNSFENFSDAAKQALTKIGDVYLPRVTAALDKISPMIEKIGQDFRNLPTSTQNALGGLAIGGAIMGPALLGVGALIKLFDGLKATIGRLALFFVSNPLTIPITLLIGAKPIANAINEAFWGGTPSSPELTPSERTKSQGENNRSRIDALQSKIARFNKYAAHDKYTSDTYRKQNAADVSELTQLTTMGPTQAGAAHTSGKPVIDAAARMAAAEAAKQAREDAKRLADEQRVALLRYQEEMAGFVSKYKEQRVKAFHDLADDMKTLGPQKASDLYKARVRAINDEEAKALAELHKTRQKKSFEERLHIEEAAIDVYKSSLGVLKAKEQEVADIRAAMMAAIAKTSLDQYIERTREDRAERMRILEADIQAERDWLDNHAGYKAPETVRVRNRVIGVDGATDEAGGILRGASKDASKAADEKARRHIRQTFGGQVAFQLGQEFGAEFGKGLDKIFGKGILGRAFARALDNFMSKQIETSLDNLFGAIGKAADRKTKATVSTSFAGGGNILPGDQPGMGGMGGNAGVYGAGLMALQQATQKKKYGPALGMAAGFAFGGPVGAMIGGAIGGLLGFADGGSPPVGRLSLVGERGPELIMPRSAMTVIPNHAIAGAMGGSTTFHAPITLNAVINNDMDIRDVARKMARHMEMLSPARPRR